MGSEVSKTQSAWKTLCQRCRNMGWLPGKLVRSLSGHHLLSPMVILTIFSPVSPDWRGDGILEAPSSSHHFPIPTLVQEMFDLAGLKHGLVFPAISFLTSFSCPSSQATWCHMKNMSHHGRIRSFHQRKLLLASRRGGRGWPGPADMGFRSPHCCR